MNNENQVLPQSKLLLKDFGKYSTKHQAFLQKQTDRQKKIDSIFQSLYQRKTIKDKVRMSDTAQEQLR